MPARETYATLRTGRAPNSLVVRALDLLTGRGGRALDIGAGPLNETRFLLQSGLAVDAVDRDSHSLALASELGDPRLHFIHADIRDVRLAAGAYTLVVALHILPFLPRVDLPRVVSSIIDALTPGGTLCCTFLGLDDAWAGLRPRMNFVSRPEIDSLFSRLQPIVCSERKYDGTNAKDEPKRWHVFRCILRKQALEA